MSNGLAMAAAATPAAMPTEAASAASGIDTQAFDRKVRAQDDLFQAANGAWLKATPIPADKSSYGAFEQLADQSDRQVRALVEKLAASPQPDGSVAQKIAAYYTSFIDLPAIDQAGLAPTQARLDGIAAIQARTDLARWLGENQGLSNLPVNLTVMPDPTQPRVNRVMALQGGLGLPDRDYYLKSDAKLRQAKTAYLVYLSTLARLSGESQPERAAARVLALETRIARLQWDKVADRDPIKTYNPMTPAELAKRAPGLDWPQFLKAGQLAEPELLSVRQPSAVVGLAGLVGSVPLSDWKLYLKLHVLDESAPVLPQAFRDAHFAFRGAALTGAKQALPRWQQGISDVNGALGEAVGQLYVAAHFPPAAKARMQEMVVRLLAAYRDSIDGLSWMTPATQAAAREKLAKYMVKIGYPDAWRDYSKLEVRAGDALGNSLRAAAFEYRRVAQRASQPVDRSEWEMTPQTVNAYYNPAFNEIVFPAAILQAPFFDMAADDAVNYGAIGAVIGHEISHGFDDEGSQYDGDGVLRNWWTAQDRKAFDAIGARLVAQFSKYESLPGKAINGRLTLGENIADLSGLQIAYKAYQNTLGGKPAPVLDGLSGDQRFFYAWAQAWRYQAREALSLQLLSVDPHAPPKFRANGAALNHDGFHEAFGTQTGDAMFKAPAQRIRIW
ncbi:M13 family metallopeptidase [Roseateles koreensis]|uniref:M13 family metallopeptidase n=1 Tax=Roseateles koreensis TaxID=2987526 RepID=A0ABT5KN11_9BURK|nr:M13 family metallopeptidase [Roseateles koreensis]MDC8783800.1 M13 family metallopeptidase [Roseateles koreensis]